MLEQAPQDRKGAPGQRQGSINLSKVRWVGWVGLAEVNHETTPHGNLFQIANKKKCAYLSPNFQCLLWKDFLNRQVLFDSPFAPHVKYPLLQHVVANLWATPSPLINILCICYF